VIPGSRFVARFAPDFLIGDQQASRPRWTLVELESPSVRLFTQSGDPTRSLNHAITRVRGWRGWLRDHTRYARERLNLANVDANADALILIGRRPRLRPDDVQRRRRLETEADVAIHTYDWLVDGATETPLQLRETLTQPCGR